MNENEIFDKNKRLRLNESEEESVSSADEISFKVITNDGSTNSAEALVTLKNIISRQLPKMPKEYIVRLIFDYRHYSLVICRGGRIIGGICYRPYLEQKFGEIAFCAINGSEQVKGFGTILMNQLKNHVQKQNLEYFLTYADNYALGYFQKQGFTKNVVMPKERWIGYIKDYDGGTLMECYIHPTINYLSVNETILKQRSFIYHRLKLFSKSNVVHNGISLFSEGKRIQPSEIPGILNSGWSSQYFLKGTTERDRISSQNKLSTLLKSFVDRVRQVLTSKQVKNSTKNIKYMSDLDNITLRLKDGDYYRTKEMMLTDMYTIMKSIRESVATESTMSSDLIEPIEKLISEYLTKDINIVIPIEKDNN